jgi:hypothetical protein
MSRILPNDILCWQLIGELGCLDTWTIHRRLFPFYTLRACQRRLRLATDAGYLRKAALAVCFNRQFAGSASSASRGGAVPVLHSITDRAADIVERETGMRPKRILRSEPAATTFLHRWQVVLLRLAFDDAAALSGLALADWIMEQDSWDAAPEGLPPNQRRLLYHRFDAAQAPLTCQPDAACCLVIPRKDTDKPPTQLLCLWETDRGTEGLKQIQRKLPGYDEYIQTRAWLRYYPHLDNVTFRIFWVAPSAERAKQLRGAIRGSAVAKFSRFAAAADMTPERILTAPVWQTIDGDGRSFLRE